MADQKLILVLLFMSAVTFFVRTAPLTVLARFEFPPLIQRSLEYVPVSILSVMLVSEVFIKNGVVHTSLSDPKLWAALLTLVFALYSRHFILTVFVGVFASALLKLTLFS